MSLTNVSGDRNYAVARIENHNDALWKRPWWDNDGDEIIPVASTRDEIQAHLEAIVSDLSITPGAAQTYDRVVLATEPHRDHGFTWPNRTVYLRHAVSGQWFTFELNVCVTDLPDHTEWDENLGEFVKEQGQ